MCLKLCLHSNIHKHHKILSFAAAAPYGCQSFSAVWLQNIADTIKKKVKKALNQDLLASTFVAINAEDVSKQAFVLKLELILYIRKLRFFEKPVFPPVLNKKKANA